MPFNNMSLALSGGRIYLSPDAKPIENGVVFIDQGKISGVGRTHDISYSKEIREIDCTGLTITAGFQNNHVHLMGDSPDVSANTLSQLRESFTRYGYTTIVDTGSFLQSTTALRSQIESGKVQGPRILTAGAPLYPVDGIPFYLKLPSDILKLLPQPGGPEEARNVVRMNISGGADIIKLFTGSIVDPERVKPMDLEVARAAVNEAHRLGKLVFCHPSNIEGIKVALNSGVDVLAHTTSEGKEWNSEFVDELLSHRMSLVPTLKLWLYEAAKMGSGREEAQAFADNCVAQLRTFVNSGGRVVFGTDAGYMTDFDPREEYILMSRSGMTPMAILESLTTAPAALFNESQSRGTIGPGMNADLVVLEDDPAEDVENYAKVVFTIRNGQIIYSRN